MTKKLHLTWEAFDEAVADIADVVRASSSGQDVRQFASGVYGQPRGGLPLAVSLSHRLRLPLLAQPVDRMIWVDDIIDSGHTLCVAPGHGCLYAAWYTRHPIHAVEALLTRRLPIMAVAQCEGDEWLVFPWEVGVDAHKEQRAYEKSRVQSPRQARP